MPVKPGEDISAELFSERNLICPHRLWQEMRDQCPVARITTPFGGNGYVVTRKEDLDYVSSHPEIYSSEVDETVQRWGNDMGPEFLPILAKGYKPVHTVVTADPPRAHFYRKITLEALSPKRINAREADIRAIIDGLIARLPGDGTVVDLRHEYAMPLPMSVILDIFGLPQEDAEHVYWLTTQCLSLFDPVTEIETAKKNAEALVETQHYLARYILRYREAPEENFLSFIANSRHKDGALMSMEEVLSVAMLSLFGGNETTRNALTYAMRTLALDPVLWRRLQADRSLVPAFVEEAVRLCGPAAMTARQAVRDSELAGVAIEKGAPLYLMWASGSRDERFFEAPEEVRLDRAKGRMHSSFGSGVHHCAGIHLARKELILAIEGLLDAYDRMELAVSAEQTGFEPRFTIRVIGALPVRLHAKKEAVAA